MFAKRHSSSEECPQFIFLLTVQAIFLRSWERASLIYSSTTNKMQRYAMVFITINALHVSGSSSTHHQELNTVHTASDICRDFSASYRYRESVVPTRQILDAVYTVLSY
jgi:hypothetical protein